MRLGKETKFWDDIAADMMSEEELVGDKYICLPPSYRSEKLNTAVFRLLVGFVYTCTFI